MYGFVQCILLASVALSVSSHTLVPSDVVFHLFTRADMGTSVPMLPTAAGIRIAGFSNDRPTIVGIHSNGDSANFNAFFVRAHLSARDANLIVVDWSRGSTMYSQGVAEAPRAGRIIADFINIIINELNYPVSNIRIVGHGLGGHVAGIAARNINGNIPHVVALDPSLHGWSHHPERLSTNAATVVEVLHATAGILGYDTPLGHLDFYPNGGTHQSGCGNDISCSHTFAYAFYAESVQADIISGPKFIGTRCANFEQATSLQCNGSRDATFGGLQSKSGITGVFTFLTNPTQPFARN